VTVDHAGELARIGDRRGGRHLHAVPFGLDEDRRTPVHERHGAVQTHRARRHPPGLAVVVLVEHVVRQRLEQDRLTELAPVLLDRDRAPLQIVLVLGLRRVAFVRPPREVAGVVEGVGDEVVPRGLDDGVVDVAGMIVQVGVAPVVVAAPVAVVVEPPDGIEHGGARLLEDHGRVMLGQVPVRRIFGPRRSRQT
jgi:hypothetical protein